MSTIQKNNNKKTGKHTAHFVRFFVRLYCESQASIFLYVRCTCNLEKNNFTEIKRVKIMYVLYCTCTPHTGTVVLAW